MPSDAIVLSILVVTHNQESLLPRCLDSLLAQQLQVPFEIIVSDDASTDGTWAVVQDYVARHPAIVRGFQENSDACSPADPAQRCGYNVSQAYSRARGRFFVNVDGDDYLRGTDIYQQQLDLLERHPDCSMCMQNIWVVQHGTAPDQGELWGPGDTLETGDVIGAADFILGSRRVLNQGYLTRRNTSVDPVARYGKFFDDTVITFHHLQFGDVVYLNRADYVYVKYPTSVDSSLQGDDREVIYGLLPLLHTALVPRFAGLFLQADLEPLLRFLELSIERPLRLGAQTQAVLAEFQGFVFRYVGGGDEPTQATRARLARALRLGRVAAADGSPASLALRRLYGVLIGREAARHIPPAHWEYAGNAGAAG